MTTNQQTRMCVGCHKKMTSEQLKRFIVTSEGITFDTSKKQPGRGSYICSDQCLDKFKNKKHRKKGEK
ncbi:MAG: YlxR family protein [Candidatus Saccharibacteria bacterium]